MNQESANVADIHLCSFLTTDNRNTIENKARRNSHSFQLSPINKEPIMFNCRIINLKVLVLHDN